jgi:subtilisin-like proprotein convertase family protein
VVALSNLAGRSARGTWKLWVESSVPGLGGTLNDWALLITPLGHR